MRALNRLVILLLLFLCSAAIYADEAADLRRDIPQLKGEYRVAAYDRLYQLSLGTDDIDYQLKCINDLLAETHHQGNLKAEGDARARKIILFYNTDLNDSIYEQVHPTLHFLASIKEWKNYYDTWTILVETYNFAGQTNTALKEVNAMFEDAKQRKDNYGMGIAFYAMGNVYANMYNDEEAASSYQKSIDILMDIKPKPIQLCDIFAYYCDVLENQKEYKKLEELTKQWKLFLSEYYQTKKEDGETSIRWGHYYLACAQAALGLDDFEKANRMLN